MMSRPKCRVVVDRDGFSSAAAELLLFRRRPSPDQDAVFQLSMSCSSMRGHPHSMVVETKKLSRVSATAAYRLVVIRPREQFLTRHHRHRHELFGDVQEFG